MTTPKTAQPLEGVPASAQALDTIEQRIRNSVGSVSRWEVDHLLHNLDSTRVHLAQALARPEPPPPPPSSLLSGGAGGGEQATRLIVTSKCEGCGSAADVRVRTTNGGLMLCNQCLGDVNRKSPLLAAATKEIERLLCQPPATETTGNAEAIHAEAIALVVRMADVSDTDPRYMKQQDYLRLAESWHDEARRLAPMLRAKEQTK